MKKLIALFLACIFILSGCSAGSSSTRSRKSGSNPKMWEREEACNEIRPYAERAIELIDAYLAFDIDADEATKEFKNLADRIQSMGFNAVDSNYSLVDSGLAHEITMLQFGNADDRTDLEYHQIRDIISYQIGGEVSGRTYPAEVSDSLFLEYPVPHELKIYDAPAAAVFFHENLIDDQDDISVYFDYLNGVTPTDTVNYALDMLDILLAAQEPVMFLVRYECYGQSVFSLYVDISADGVHGFVTVEGINDSAGIESADDVKPAFEDAAKYFKGP